MFEYGTVTDRSRVVLSAVAGALAGAVAGYLYFTRDGERLRTQLGPGVEEMLGRLQELQASVQHARGVAEQSWAALRDVTRETGRG